MSRPGVRKTKARVTSFKLDFELDQSILRLQLHTLEKTGKKPTMADLLCEGLSKLMVEAGLGPLRRTEPASPESVVVPIRTQGTGV